MIKLYHNFSVYIHIYIFSFNQTLLRFFYIIFEIEAIYVHFLYYITIFVFPCVFLFLRQVQIVSFIDQKNTKIFKRNMYYIMYLTVNRILI